jgi:site-specific recombinase XerC
MTPIESHACEYLAWMEVHNYARTTVASRRRYLSYFVGFAACREVTDARSVELELLLAYQHEVFTHRKRDGTQLAFGTQAQRLIPVVQFFSWLRRERRIAANPAADLPDASSGSPASSLDAQCNRDVLVARRSDVTRPLGLRDRAMLEVFYSCGLRRSELIALWLRDVDFARGTLFIRCGKGKKDRCVPIGERALSGSGCMSRSRVPSLRESSFPITRSFRRRERRAVLNGSARRSASTSVMPGSQSLAVATSYATASPRSSSKGVPISGTSPRCSATPGSKRLSGTPACQSRSSVRYTRPVIQRPDFWLRWRQSYARRCRTFASPSAFRALLSQLLRNAPTGLHHLAERRRDAC